MNIEENRKEGFAQPIGLNTLVDEVGKPRWYVVQSEPQREKFALCRLRETGFVSYLPMRPIAKKSATYAAPLFPSYLFAQMDLEDGTWWRVFTTLGVAAVITRTSRAGRPVPLAAPVGTVRRIMTAEVGGLVQLTKKADKDKRSADAAPFQAGAKVKITGGQFLDHDALFMHGDANRVAVLIAMLGGEVQVSLSRTDVQAA